MQEILSFDVDKIIWITHAIRGYPNHFFTADNTIYQKQHCLNKRTKPAHLVAKIRNGMTRGYFLNGKFKSLTFLESKRYPIMAQVIFSKETEFMPF